ncbi:hypothetical protein [Micromonospora sp. NPDC049359]|uniref:hypothetical protein n=1 Tax=Micromonospora sp. NPDC049359 TaxID=3364270 RepID=UPI0037B6B007
MSTQVSVPERGPVANRPRQHGQAPPHTPLRPHWACRADGQPWPCATARLMLKAEYEDTMPSLSIYLAGLMYEAMRDLYHLNPHDGPSPQALFDRFVGWGPFRRPAVEAATSRGGT